MVRRAAHPSAPSSTSAPTAAATRPPAEGAVDQPFFTDQFLRDDGQQHDVEGGAAQRDRIGEPEMLMRRVAAETGDDEARHRGV
ncbi:MAG: hypothetical protein HC850_17435 [Rhodomicrobium sp.]|nr:hypothetical protein [Rhodomicrobium sp.]